MSDVFYMILGVGLFAAMVLYAFVSPAIETRRASPSFKLKSGSVDLGQP